MDNKIPSALILYHFFYPDDVVSSRHFSDFAQELVKRGWKVTVLTSNRYCRYPEKKIDCKRETWEGVQIVRTFRPPWNQANNYLRLANSLWLMIGWGFRLCTLPRADTIIIGTDPQFAALMFPFLRFMKRAKILVHWCYDLYPEAIVADNSNRSGKLYTKGLKFLMKQAYKSIDILVDIGACMRKLLNAYNHKAQSATLVPWALAEPHNVKEPDMAIRKELFGDAKLALLYSGNMGKAHEFMLFLKLARAVYKKNPHIVFCFACRGNMAMEIEKAVSSSDQNIRFASFTEESDLEKRLGSADIHMLSLKPEWNGVVVPSKFFGSLASGRAVLYAGSEDSDIGEWIKEFKVGMILTENNIDHIADQLLQIVNDNRQLEEWQNNAYNAGQIFSKKNIMDQWDNLLRDRLNNEKIQN